MQNICDDLATCVKFIYNTINVLPLFGVVKLETFIFFLAILANNAEECGQPDITWFVKQSSCQLKILPLVQKFVPVF